MITNILIRGKNKHNLKTNKIKEFHLFVEGYDNDYVLLTYNETNMNINKRYPFFVSVLFTDDNILDSFKPKSISLDISKKELEDILGISIFMIYVFFERHNYFVIYDKYRKNVNKSGEKFS